MSGITLLTSGSTDVPKKVFHSWDYLTSCATRSINETQLSKDDIVLDVFPANTIAHYTVTAYPAVLSKSQLYTASFNAFSYIEIFKDIKPTVISLIPKHLELLKNTKGFASLDMSSVRYMITGSNKIEQDFIDTFRNQGVKLVANWYGMTECPPPILVGYNSTRFNLNTLCKDEKIVFDSIDSMFAECVINDRRTGDIFNMTTMEFHSRKTDAVRKTWKTDI